MTPWMRMALWAVALGGLAGSLAIRAAMAGSNGVGTGGLSGPAGGQSVNGAPVSPSSVTTSFIDAGVLSVDAPTGVECVAGFDSPDTSTRAICLDRKGGLGIDGTKPYIGWSTGSQSMTISNLGGHININPGSGNRLATTERFYSSIAAASCAFEVATEGALVCVGPDTRWIEQGTRLRASAGVDGTAGSGTGITVNATSNLAHQVHRITFINTALDAAGTSDETIWTVPAKTRIIRMVADVTQTFSGGGITDMDVVCGPSAGSSAYLVSFDVDTAIGTYGEVAAEIGAGLLSATYADIPSWSGTTAIVCRFTCAGANCSAATQGSVSFYIEHMVFP